jgi:hypothetical protein
MEPGSGKKWMLGGWNPSAGTDAWAPVTQLSMPHFPSTVIAPTVACSAPHGRSQEAELNWKLDLHHLPSPLTHHTPQPRSGPPLYRPVLGRS